MTHIRRLCTFVLTAATLFTHAQCMRVHYDDGWTEQIDVTTATRPVSFPYTQP